MLYFDATHSNAFLLATRLGGLRVYLCKRSGLVSFQRVPFQLLNLPQSLLGNERKY